MARTSKRVSKAKRARSSKTARVTRKTFSKPSSKARSAKKVAKKAKVAIPRAKTVRHVDSTHLSLASASQKGALADLLYDNVKMYAKNRGYRLRPGAIDWLRNSTAKMQAKHVDAGIAFAAYEKLIDAMIEESKTIPNYPPGGIGERTLYPVLEKLCPLFPIC